MDDNIFMFQKMRQCHQHGASDGLQYLNISENASSVIISTGLVMDDNILMFQKMRQCHHQHVARDGRLPPLSPAG
jgi:hypothetical protein